MKVRALNHLHQTVGVLSVERVLHTVFEIDDETADAAIQAGIVEAVEEPSKSKKKYHTVRETK